MNSFGGGSQDKESHAWIPDGRHVHRVSRSRACCVLGSVSFRVSRPMGEASGLGRSRTYSPPSWGGDWELGEARPWAWVI